MAMMRGTKIVEPAQLRLIGSISVGEREAAVFRCTFFTDRRSPWKYATPRPMFPVIGILSMRVRFVPPSQPHFTREHSAVFEEERVANLENFFARRPNQAASRFLGCMHTNFTIHGHQIDLQDTCTYT